MRAGGEKSATWKDKLPLLLICKLRGFMLVLPAYLHSSAGKIFDLHMAGKINDHALRLFVHF